MSLVVADIGNSRIKWGLCSDRGIAALAALGPDDPDAWLRQWQEWSLTESTWVIASVAPRTRERFAHWLRDRASAVHFVDSYRDIAIDVAVDNPERIGLDRLLDAVAANERRAAGQSALIVDAGSAVTVDLVDAHGAFRGGAIFPGLRLMAKALNDYTSQLPFVDIRGRRPPPGSDTTAAIEAGVFHAVAGGIDRLLADMRSENAISFLTGGDASLLAPHLRSPIHVWPEMTLVGLRLVAKR